MQAKSNQQEEKDKRNWKEIWQDYFVEDTTFHGWKYFFARKSSPLKRIVWLSIVLVCTGAFGYNLWMRASYYASSPVNVNIQINYLKKINFPAVTICNQNSYRLSEAYNYGYYPYLADLYDGVQPLSEAAQLFFKETPNFTQLYQALAHKKEDLIFQCYFSGEECFAENFTLELTDYSYCFTFNANISNRLQVRQSGAGYGLQLTLNIEQYEYMSSSENAAGVKVLIHSPDELIRIVDLGFNVPPGMQGLVGMQVTKVENVPWKEPYCREKQLRYYKHLAYSSSACDTECSTDYLRRICGCHPIEIPRIPKNDTDLNNEPENNEPDCGPLEYQLCIRPTRGDFRDSVECDCPVSCFSSSYLPVISYASLSRFNARRILYDQPQQMDTIHQNFLRAREAEARSRDLERDRAMFRQIENTLESMSKSNIFPDSDKLKFLKAGVWTVCFNNSIHMVQQYKKMSSDALRVLEDLVYPLTDFDRGLMITIYVQMLWNVGIRLELIELTQIAPLIEAVQKNLQDIPFNSGMNVIINEALKVESFTTDIIEDFNITSKNLNDFLKEHSYLEFSVDFAEYSAGLRNFTVIENKCLPDFKRDTNASFSKIFEILTAVISSKTVSDQQIQNLEKIFEDLAAKRKRCQVHQINNAKYSRESFERFYNALIRDVSLNEEQMYMEFRSPFKELETWNFQIDNGKRMISSLNAATKRYWDGNITKLELAMFLTGNTFQDETKMFQEFLQGLRGYILANRQAMMNYLNGFYSIPNGTSPVIRGFHQQKNYSAFRLYYEGNWFSAGDIEFCTSRVESTTNELVKRISRMEREISNGIHNATKQMEKYIDQCQMNTNFMMNNFLDLSIYFRELREERITQQRAYNVWGLISDVGGGMGLFLGASFITVFELFDTLYNSSRHQLKPQRKRKNSHVHPETNGLGPQCDNGELQHHLRYYSENSSGLGEASF